MITRTPHSVTDINSGASKLIFDDGHPLPPLAATIGVFDGVHSGHRSVLKQLTDYAKEHGLASAVVTFAAPPVAVLRPDTEYTLLTTIEEKKFLLEQTGIDYMIVLPFDKEMSCLSAQEFIVSILAESFHVKTLFVGYDHRFGRNREETVTDYQVYGQSVEMNVIPMSPLTNSQMGVNPSSSLIRHLLTKGDITGANRLLGYNYLLSGTVEDGFKIGRSLGYPTANVRLNSSHKQLPPAGVYAVKVWQEDAKLPAMMYFGSRPTLRQDLPLVIEINILDFSQNLYGQQLYFEICQSIRGEEKFDSMEALKTQIVQDEQDTRDYFSLQ